MSDAVPWQLRYTDQAENDLVRLPQETRSRVQGAIDALRLGLAGRDVRKLQGEGNVWRLRVGDWRVRFVPERSTRTMVILRVLSRDKAYRD